MILKFNKLLLHWCGNYETTNIHTPPPPPCFVAVPKVEQGRPWFGRATLWSLPNKTPITLPNK